MERLSQAVAARGHEFRAHSEPAFDAAGGDLVGDVLYGFQAGGAEPVDGGGGGGGGEASGEGGGADEVGGFGVVDL